MATNKHAIIRYRVLDKCFSNFARQFVFNNLMEACNDAIYQEYGECGGVSIRTIRDDIRFMKSEDGYSAPIETYKDGGKPYYRYTDKNFSINNRPISETEIEQIKETVMMLSRFNGLPKFEWISDVLKRLESGFQINSHVSEVVGFEQNIYLKGLSNFNPLFEAIVNKCVLNIIFHPAFDSAVNYILHPYYLKQYNNRWFLFGWSIDRIMNMPLDRIESFEVIKEKYIENDSIDFSEYFDDVVGVSVPFNKDVETIVLRVDRKRYNYIESKPLHPTQKVIQGECTDNYVTIQLNLIRNYEFETLLLGFADSVEIIEPISLREGIKNRVQNILIKNR